MRSILTWIRNLFVANWNLKLLAIVLASLTFYTIRGAISFEVPYTVPVEVRAGPGLAVLEKSVSQVDVTFGGSQEDLRRLDPAQLRAVVRPEETSPGGTEVIQIRPRDITGVGNVRVVSIRPSSLKVTYDREAERDVLVLPPKTSGSPLFGRVELDFEPKTVRLRGPKRRLANVRAVSCEPVDVDGRVESFVRRVKVLSPGDTWVYDIEPDEIEVTVNIITEVVTRSFQGLRVLAVTAPGRSARIEVQPPTVDVRVQGRSELLEAIVPDTISVYVSCVGLEQGADYDLPVMVHLPSEADMTARVTPASVTVRILEP